MTKTVAKSGCSLWRSLPLLLGTLSAGALLLFAFPATAQDSGSSDVDSTFGDNDGLSMFELMHRAQQGQIRNPYEFSQDQQESINDAAADFRTRQQEAIQQQQPQGTIQPIQNNPDSTVPSEENQL